MIKVAIHSVPRSGSSWLGELFNSHPNLNYSYQPLFSYKFKDYLNESSSEIDVNNFFNEILKSDDEFIKQKISRSEGKLPTFDKKNISHVVYKEVRYHHIVENLLKKNKDIKVVGLLRNPFSVIYSWLKAPKEFRSDLGWKMKDEWRFANKKNLNKKEEFNGYEKWKEVSFMFLEFQRKYPDQFYLVSYGDLLKDTKSEVQKLFDFCQLEYTSQTDIFIKDSTASQAIDAYSVFKQKKDDLAWQETLPKFIVDEIKADKDFIKLNNVFEWL